MGGKREEREGGRSKNLCHFATGKQEGSFCWKVGEGREEGRDCLSYLVQGINPSVGSSAVLEEEGEEEVQGGSFE